MNSIKGYAFKGIIYNDKCIWFGMKSNDIQKQLGRAVIIPDENIKEKFCECRGALELFYFYDRLTHISFTSENWFEIDDIVMDEHLFLNLALFDLLRSGVHVLDALKKAYITDLGLIVDYSRTPFHYILADSKTFLLKTDVLKELNARSLQNNIYRQL